KSPASSIRRPLRSQCRIRLACAHIQRPPAPIPNSACSHHMAAPHILPSADRADCAAVASCRYASSGCDRYFPGCSPLFPPSLSLPSMRHSRVPRIRLFSPPSVFVRPLPSPNRQHDRCLGRLLLVRAVEGGCDLRHEAVHLVLHLLVRLEADVEVKDHLRKSGGLHLLERIHDPLRRA